MKRSLVFFVSGIITPTLLALSLDPKREDHGIPIRKPTPIKEIPLDDATLRGVIFDLVDNIWLDIHTGEDVLLGIQSIAKEGGVTPERMTKMLESIVREGLREMQKAERGSAEYSAAAAKVVEPVEMLNVFHGPDTLALVKECARSGHGGCVSAMKTYINLVGAVEALPFLGEILIGEIVAKGGKDLNPHRGGLFKSLQNAANNLAKENKNDDALKIYIFLMGLAIMECEPNAAVKLDQILCSGLPDYATSIEREKAIGKFADFPMNTDYFKNIKAEIIKVPVSKRRDYSKQPLRVPKESEKEIKIMLPSR